MILAGRRLNDSMAEYVAIARDQAHDQTQHPAVRRARSLLGLTFKENCPDVRNTKVADIVRELKSFGCKVDVHDPWVEPGRSRARVRHLAGRRAEGRQL